MSNKELTINAVATIDDVLSKLSDLMNGITGIPESVDITLNVDGNATEVIESVKNDFASLEESATTAGDGISSSMSSATESTQDMGFAAQDAAHSTTEVGEQALITGESAEEGFGAAELGALAFLGTLELINQGLNTTNALFDRMSNATIPETNLRNMVADITNVTMNVGEALDYITVLRRLGVTSEESLGRGATAMNTLQEGTNASEMDVQNLIASYRTLGVDLENIESTYNAVAYVNARMHGGIATYSSLMGRYSYRFKEMGLSADQSAVLLVAAQRKFGTNPRELYKGLNLALKESGGDLFVLQEKLGLTNNELINASSLTGQFTGKLESNTAANAHHTSGLQKTGAAVEDVNIKFGDFIGVLTTFGGLTTVVLGGIGIAIPAALKGFDKLWDTNLAPRYMDWLRKNFVGPTKNIASNIGSGVKGIGDDVFTKLFPQVSTKSVANADDLVKYYAKFGDEIGKGGSSFTSKIKEFLKGINLFGDEGGKVSITAANKFGGQFAKVPRIIGNAVKIGTKGLGSVLRVLGSDILGPAVGEFFAPENFGGYALAGGDISWWFGPEGPAGAQIKGMQNDWNNLFSTSKGSLYDQLNFIGFIQGQLKSMPPLDWNTAMGIPGIREAAMWIDSGLEWMGGEIIGFITSFNPLRVDWAGILGDTWLVTESQKVIDSVKEFIDKLWESPNELYRLGRQLMKKLVDGMINEFPGLKQFLQWISDHFPKSPPKIGPLAAVTAAGMEEYGTDLSSGLAKGTGSYQAPTIDPYNVRLPTGQKFGDWYDSASRQVSSGVGVPGGGGYGRTISEDQTRVRRATEKDGTDAQKNLNEVDQQNNFLKQMSGRAKTLASTLAWMKQPFFKNIAQSSSTVIQARREAQYQKDFRAKYGMSPSQAIGGGQQYSGPVGGITYVTGMKSQFAGLLGKIRSGEAVRGRDYAVLSNARTNAAAASAARAAATQAVAQQQRQQVIEGQNITVKISDVKIRSDMDIKHVANELGREIGRQARQNGIRVVSQVR